jgi:WD40 repeat protein
VNQSSNPDWQSGCFFLTGHADGNIYMWNIDHGRAPLSSSGSDAKATRPEEYYLGTYVVSPVWSFNRMHGSAVSCMSLSVDNSRFASGDIEGNIFVWTNQEEETF